MTWLLPTRSPPPPPFLLSTRRGYVLKSRDGHKRLGKTVSGERTGCILTDLEPNQTYWLALEVRACMCVRVWSVSRLNLPCLVDKVESVQVCV